MDLREVLKQKLTVVAGSLPAHSKKLVLSVFYAGMRCTERDLSSVFAFLEYDDSAGNRQMDGFELKKFYTIPGGLQEFHDLAEELQQDVVVIDVGSYVGRYFKLTASTSTPS